MRPALTWQETRALLAGGGAALGEEAAAFYPHIPRVASSALLSRPEWIPAAPVPLDELRLEWEPDAAPPAVTGAEEAADGNAGFATYAEAVAALAKPALFEDRPSYRLLRADLREARTLRMSAATYFDGVNVGEAVAHETAAGTPGAPLRTRIGDPCDLSRRPALMAITTVTLRAPDTYVLHWRDPAKVAHAGGLYQVMPVGVFQPGTATGRDFDLWRCMAREFSEELLGSAEEYGPDFAYETWPFFQSLETARAEGGLRVYCLGLGVDPLTLAVDLLTVAVFNAQVFGELFAALADRNAEGEVRLAPFDGTAPSPMQPAGAAALDLAWRHRRGL